MSQGFFYNAAFIQTCMNIHILKIWFSFPLQRPVEKRLRTFRQHQVVEDQKMTEINPGKSTEKDVGKSLSKDLLRKVKLLKGKIFHVGWWPRNVLFYSCFYPEICCSMSLSLLKSWVCSLFIITTRFSPQSVEDDIWYAALGSVGYTITYVVVVKMKFVLVDLLLISALV